MERISVGRGSGDKIFSLLSCFCFAISTNDTEVT